MLEWRVFIPKTLDQNVVPASDGRHEKLKNILALVNPLIPGIESIEPEVRDDSYIVVDRHCGLKFRGGKKLEIKVRHPYEGKIGVEKYTKTKLKKKPVAEQVSSIVELLKEYGYENSEVFEREIRSERCITISKSRVNVNVQLAVVEICHIRVEECDHVHPVTAREWTSVAVEADNIEAIQGVLASATFKSFIQSLLELNREARDLPMYPVVCGYPFWVQYLTGQYSSEDLASVLEPFQHIIAL